MSPGHSPLKPKPEAPDPVHLGRIAYRVALWRPSDLLEPKKPRPRTRWSGFVLVPQTVGAERSGKLLLGVSLLGGAEDIMDVKLFYREGIPAKDVQAVERFADERGLDSPVPVEGFLRALYRYGYKRHVPIAAFDLPAHLSRLATDWTAPKKGTFYDGGVSLIPWTKRPCRRAKGKRPERVLPSGRVEEGHRPHIVLKVLTEGGVAIRFTHRAEPDPEDQIPEGSGGRPQKGYQPPGHFVPLERLASGLTGTRFRRLAEACAAFGVAYDPPPAPVTGAISRERIERASYEAEASFRLYRALLARHGQHQGLDLAPDQVYSPASYAKAIWDAMGLVPPLAKWKGSLDALGIGACASYGGWSGVGVRGLPDEDLPVVRIDATGEYPVDAHLLGMWDLQTAREIDVLEENPAAIGAWIGARRWTDLLDPALWRELNVFVRIRPRGDFLPHRIRPRETWTMNIALLTYEGELWWPLSDALVSYFETGRVPEIEAAVRVVGRGKQRGLNPVELPGIGTFDPTVPGAGFFLFLAEGRLRLADNRRTDLPPEERERLAEFYKVWDNSACSGVFLETHPKEPTARPGKHRVIGPDGAYEARSRTGEEPGSWFCPPFYALVTGGGRLLLYLAMRAVREAGGTVAYWDTDSLAVVATPEGGLVPCPGGPDRLGGRRAIRALSYVEVDGVRWLLEALSPYSEAVRPYFDVLVEDPAPAGSGRGRRRRRAYPVRVPRPRLFALEDENFPGGTTYESPTWGRQEVHLRPVASKRYTPYVLRPDVRHIEIAPNGPAVVTSPGGPPEVVSPSEFALGHLLDPRDPWGGGTDWINEAWGWGVLSGDEPPWLDEPALSRITLPRFEDIERLRGGDRSRGMDVRPWSLLVVGYADPQLGWTEDGRVPRAVAHWTPGFTVEGADWYDWETGGRIGRVRVAPTHLDESALSVFRPLYLRAFRSVLTAHFRAAETKSLGPDGFPCGPRTAGLLSPRPTEAYEAVPIGRETSFGDEVGVIRNPEYTEYPDPRRDPTARRALLLLRERAKLPGGRRGLAKALRISLSTLDRYLRSGRARRKTLDRALELAVSVAREDLRRQALTATLPDEGGAVLYLHRVKVGAIGLRCQRCGEPLTGRELRWCADCADEVRKERVREARRERRGLAKP